ncbi:MAG: hypothetical protein AB2L14_28020 [Candidatus Xenobiia bacterium LiM19]
MVIIEWEVMVMTDLSLSGAGIHHGAVQRSLLLSGKDADSVKDGTTPPPGGDPNPPPNPPPPAHDDFSPSSLGFSIPAYGGTFINSACIGVKAYLRSAGTAATTAPVTAPPSSAGNAASTADATAATAGTAPADGAALARQGGNNLIHDVSRVGTWMAGFATGLMALKGGMELYSGIKHKNDRSIINGALDLSIGASNALTAVPPLAQFAALTAVLLTGVKILSDTM